MVSPYHVPREEYEDFRDQTRRDIDEIKADVRRLVTDQSTIRDNVRTETAGAVKAMNAQLAGAQEANLASRRFHWTQVWVIAGPILGGIAASVALHLLS